MRKLKFIFIVTFLLCCLIILNRQNSYAEDASSTPAPYSDVQQQKEKEIKELENKITDLKSQSKTLASQIAVMDSQIKLTQLRIEATEDQISTISKDIDTTTKKITTLEETLNQVTKLLINRIIATYEIGSNQPLHILLSSSNVSDFFVRANYLKIVQAHDKKLIYETQQAKNDYTNQKEIFEDKKKKFEVLNKQLIGYTQQIDREKKQKEDLLIVTKNSESEYQKRLAAVLRELSQIQSAARLLISTDSKRVSKGEIIGLMGNTGYSFGAHLHFGVYTITSLEQYDYYSHAESPSTVLQSQNVDWQTECNGDPKGSTSTGAGSFVWPMSTGDLHITQGFGHTCYSDVYYKGNPHPAFDMYNNSDIVIRAAEDGQAYFCRNCTGDGGNGVFIFHPNGKMTLYWHLQ